MTLTATTAPPGRPPGDLLERLAGRVTVAGPRPPLTETAPATGRPLGAVPHCTGADVELALTRARSAQTAWERTPVRDRADVLLRFHDLLLDRRDEVLDLIQAETGKARRHAFEEVADVAGVARYYARTAARHLASRRRRGAFPVATWAVEHRVPVGVVGVLAPWNYPLVLTIGDALPALAAGNAVVVKPDHQTSFTALWGADLLADAGLPTDLLQVVTGPGEEVGPAVVDAVDFVMYTGSTRTGRLVAQQAAARLVGSSMELGGKNPMVVLADADLGRTVEGALRACFSNAGQLCISMERIYVERPAYDEFLRRFVERTSRLALGSGNDYRTEMGSLQSQRQLDTVTAHVDDAVRRGARVETGGRPRPDAGPLCYEPTILTGVTPEMTCYAEETFGPVVAVYAVADADEAVARANATAYGLNASVWSRDVRRAHAVARRIRAGTVNVNEGYGSAWGSTDAPMGGMKASGLGRRHGAEGILKYTEAQTVAGQRGLRLEPMFGLPFPAFAKLVAGLLRVLRRLPW